MSDFKQTGFVDDWDDVLTEMSMKKDPSNFRSKWIEQASAKHTDPVLIASEALRKFYPKHSLVATDDNRLNVLNFPGIQAIPLKDNPLVTTVGFSPLSRSSAPIPSGAFTVNWQNTEFILHIVQYPMGLIGFNTATFILHEGPEEPARQLLLKAGIWSEAVHNEIWVFNQGFWQKDGALWDSIQKADWKDVILKPEFKEALRKDVFGFFDSEQLYKDLGIPWKRGLIMHGPPGNGKTISLKAVMKTCDAKGYLPLYVKSFQSFAGDEFSMRAVFGKARQLAPCVVILEDIDSLITDRNRSFFLNELDGLEGNDGLLVVATTNHFDRLDPGLSTRPSRFDRKYLFDDPDKEERTLYAVYWQNKLKNNKSIDFSDALVDEVADATEKFSFAYLKEAFVSALVTLAGLEDEEKPSFRSVLLRQIDILRKQLDKPKQLAVTTSAEGDAGTASSSPAQYMGRYSRVQTEALRHQNVSGNGVSSKIFVTQPPRVLPSVPPFNPRNVESQHRFDSDVKALRARIQVPGSFGSSEEYEFGRPSISYVPSSSPPPRSAANDTLPGIPGFWL
ncbi:hypothetical protein GYMLUDRAFT_36752 [Collybiopsis luxurians FD-317 M1]|nr:hypothetical protein GYMLUDRAFT_36752 [Collybiopsis luxurians FD-317 M1]